MVFTTEAEPEATVEAEAEADATPDEEAGAEIEEEATATVEVGWRGTRWSWALVSRARRRSETYFDMTLFLVASKE